MALLALWNPNIQFLKTDGTINAGGKIIVTDHNDAESIPANYSDADGTTLNSSPIVLDALGRATCYIDDGSTYDLYVKDANGATLWTVPEMTPGTETIVVRAGFSVSSNDRSVAVTISVDSDGVTNYDLSIKKEIDRAIAAEKASRTEIVAGDNITVDKTVGADGHDVYTVSGESKDNLVDDVRVNGASVVTDKVANIDVPVAGTASPIMDGKASVGNSLKYAREDHVHPSDTSREDIVNKTTVVLGTSDSKYPTDKAVAKFVNSSIATNTANYISNNGEPFTSVEQLEAYSGPVTNNDYAFVTGTDSEGNTYYDRYKATVSGSTVTWALEYRLNNSSFTAAQWSAINSGITSVLVAKIHDHSNKDVLDGITSDKVNSWDGKEDAFEVLPTTKGGTGSNTAAGARTNLSVYSKSEIDSLMSGLVEIVTELPATGKSGVTYYVGPTGSGADKYDEYIWTGSAFLKVGEHSLDLSNYVNTVTTSGSGSVVTGVSKSGNTVTVTKGNISLDDLSDWATETDITIANGDKLVVTDASDSNKVGRASLTFDGATTDQMLSKKGEWSDTIAKARAVVDYAAPYGEIEIGWGGSSVTSPRYFAVYVASANGYKRAIKDCTLGTVRQAINGTSVGSTAVPVFINANSEPQVCTDDFVHDGDVTSTYSSTGTAPVNGTAVAAAIGGLDVSSVGGDGKYISAISETDGKISATATTMDTTPTAGSTNPVTSDGIKTAIDTVNAKGITVKEISGEQVICFE